MLGITNPSEIPPETLLSRRQLSAALRRLGYPGTETTLEMWANRGGGPPLLKWNNVLVRYKWGPALDWARSRLSKPQPMYGSHSRVPEENEPRTGLQRVDVSERTDETWADNSPT
jgi:hypothetical protein